MIYEVPWFGYIRAGETAYYGTQYGGRSNMPSTLLRPFHLNPSTYSNQPVHFAMVFSRRSGGYIGQNISELKVGLHALVVPEGRPSMPTSRSSRSCSLSRAFITQATGQYLIPQPLSSIRPH